MLELRSNAMLEKVHLPEILEQLPAVLLALLPKTAKLAVPSIFVPHAMLDTSSMPLQLPLPPNALFLMSLKNTLHAKLHPLKVMLDATSVTLLISDPSRLK